MTLQEKCFAELDGLSKLDALTSDGEAAKREHLITVLDAIYRDEIKREKTTASEIYNDWREAHIQIKD
jgi:hypothetical protein